jgi:hypothetical protein
MDENTILTKVGIVERNVWWQIKVTWKSAVAAGCSSLGHPSLICLQFYWPHWPFFFCLLVRSGGCSLPCTGLASVRMWLLRCLLWFLRGEREIRDSHRVIITYIFWGAVLGFSGTGPHACWRGALTASSTPPALFFVMNVLEIGSRGLFARASFKLWSS